MIGLESIGKYITLETSICSSLEKRKTTLGFFKKKGRRKGAGDGCTVNAVVIFVRHVKGHQTGSAFFNGSLLSL
jgi:hypothetical protein